MPVPRAEISDLTSLLPRILSSRARSVLRILPLRGRMAWKCRSRPCLAEPPAGLGVLLQEDAERFAHDLLDLRLGLGVHQLDLGLALELRVAVLDRDNGRPAFAGVIAGEVRGGVLEHP